MKIKLPKNNAIRVYCALGYVSVIFSNLSVKDFDDFSIRGTDEELQILLWTAMMLLGPIKFPTFSHKLIRVNGFDPNKELGWFGRFGANSFHDRVFLPVLGGKKFKSLDNESNKRFGHHVPKDQPELKAEVEKLLCENFLLTYCEVQNTTFKFSGLTTANDDKFCEILKHGNVKITQALAQLSPDVKEFRFPVIPQNTLTLDRVEMILGWLPNQFEILNLSLCPLGQIAKSQVKLPILVKLFSNPASIHTLNISYCHLGDANIDILANAIKETGKNIYYIIASNNDLYKLGVNGLMQFFSSLSAKVKAIKIHDNKFDFFTGPELAKALSAIPKTVNYVGFNDLGCLKKSDPNSTNLNEIGIAMNGLHDAVETLILDLPCLSSELTQSEVNDLVRLVKNLPKSISKLYINKILTTPENLIRDIVNKYKQREVEKLEKRIENNSAQLHSLCFKFDAKVSDVSSLVQNDIDINYQDSSKGTTALMNALGAQNDAVAEYLLIHGANPFLKNKMGDIASKLVSRNSMIYPILKGYELLHLVSTNNIVMATTALNNAGNNLVNNTVDFQGMEGYTAVMYAAEQSLPEMMSLLLEHSPNLSICNESGKTAFDLATNPTMKKMLNDYQNSMAAQFDEQLNDDSENHSAHAPHF